jgi:hypothetical protein
VTSSGIYLSIYVCVRVRACVRALCVLKVVSGVGDSSSRYTKDIALNIVPLNSYTSSHQWPPGGTTTFDHSQVDIVPFCFAENTVKWQVCLYMLENFLFPYSEESDFGETIIIYPSRNNIVALVVKIEPPLREPQVQHLLGGGMTRVVHFFGHLVTLI